MLGFRPRIARPHILVALISIAALAYAHRARATDTPDAAPPRLSRDVVPTEQSVELTLDPKKTTYTGKVSVKLTAHAAAQELRFHARALTIDRATLRGPRGEIRVTAIEKIAPDQVRLRLAHALEPGAHHLELAFHNAYNTKSISLYRVVTGGDSYLFTQFEDTEAREAFPCWDEPEFKIPWNMTFVVPASDLAIGNTPVAAETKSGAMKRVQFAKSKPLPSYLIAIAVGPFETVPITGMSSPGRIVTVKGASSMAGEAAKATPPILASLERYFGRPYPYEKLDLIAAPEFLFGAMENAGAVVFADRRLLMDPRSVSPSDRQVLGSIIAHELAHMWFGDLVTMRWWDDLWLNESFASWMATRVMDDVQPQTQTGTAKLLAVQRAFSIDSRGSTRPIRAKITGATNLGQTANELTYNKGEAVLTMFEGWLGREKFREGVLAYLKEHEWRNAEAADLWRALGTVSGEDIDGAMATFLDQSGVPLVTLEPVGKNRVKLSQSRFITIGTPDVANPTWRIPVILRYPVKGGALHTQRAWLNGPSTIVELQSASMPKWIVPNGGASGYYRWSVPAAMRDSLVLTARPRLTPRERIDLIGNLTAQLRAGMLPGDRYLALVSRLADDPSPEVVRHSIEAINDSRVALSTEASDRAWSAYVRSTLQPTVSRFGIAPRSGEPESVEMMRPLLLRFLGDAGRDSRVLAYADSVSAAYRRDPSSVPASVADQSVILAAIQGDRALFDDYRKRFEATNVPLERPMYLQALGNFRDAKLRDAALDYALKGPLRPHERLMIPNATALNQLGGEGRFSGVYSDETTQWMMEHFAELRSMLPPNFATRIMTLGAGCSEARRNELRAFFALEENRIQRGEATFSRMTDSMDECARLHARESERAERWLTMRAAAP